jgi:DNA-binding HxlR family transcriptional regulator
LSVGLFFELGSAIIALMSTRYPQSCALARAAEVLGERWTLLIIRELLLGPKRFTDIKGRLCGVSTSVLTERLTRLQDSGVVRRFALAPPAASTVYELTATGRALEPAIYALVRWGAGYLLPLRPGEPMEPDWLRMVLAAYARETRSPAHRYEIRVRSNGAEAVIHVSGGAKGTTVGEAGRPSDVRFAISSEDLLALMAGRIRPADGVRDGRIEAEGDLSALDVFSELFDASISEGSVHVKE